VPMPTMTRTNSKNGVTFIYNMAEYAERPPCRLSVALRTQFPAPFRGNNQISLSDNVVASGNARRSSSAVHKSATARGLRGVALSSGTIWRSVSGDPDQTSTTYRH
jgi:hypothetical protein